MAFIASSRNFPLPKRIAEIIHSRNPNSVLQELDKPGLWILEGSSILVFQTWLSQCNIPAPWDQAIYRLLYSLAWGTYKEEGQASFLVADEPVSHVQIALTPDLSSFVDELSKRFTLDPREVVLGLLYQTMNRLVEQYKEL